MGHYVPDQPSFVGMHQTIPMAPTTARKASSTDVFKPEYGDLQLAGTAASLNLGARRYGLPEGARIGLPEDGRGRVVLVLDGDVLHALTPAGEITNLPLAAASALGDECFGRPDVKPPP